MKAHGFRVCFTPLLEVLFTFPSRYLCAIGLSVVFSLAGGSPPIPAEFLVLRGTQVPPGGQVCISRTGLSPAVATLSCVFRYASPPAPSAVLQPRALPQDNPGLGSCAFARHYLRNRCYFLFLRVLRCFSSPGSPRDIVAVSGSLPTGFPIRTSAGHRAFAPHRGFSQLVTSFFASESHRHPPCALVRFLLALVQPPHPLRRYGALSRATRRLAAAAAAAYIRLARFFSDFTQSKSLDFFSFCVPTMSMISLKSRSPRQT